MRKTETAWQPKKEIAAQFTNMAAHVPLNQIGQITQTLVKGREGKLSSSTETAKLGCSDAIVVM